MKRLFLPIVMIFLVTGCAKVEIREITSDKPYEEGIRFYRSYPYLWVTKDKGETLKGSIIWLPKKDEEYVINIKSGIGTVDVKFTLENGWNLTQFGETRDSKTPEMITALTGPLKDIKGLLKLLKKEELRPGLYMFIFDDTTGFISDIEPIIQFK